MIDKAQIIANAERGIELLKQSQPGCGDAWQRRANRERGNAMLRPYFGVYSWPKRLQAAAENVMKQLCEL